MSANPPDGMQYGGVQLGGPEMVEPPMDEVDLIDSQIVDDVLGEAQQMIEKEILPRMQLDFSEKEQELLLNRIKEDYDDALNDHQERLNKFARFQSRWRTRIGQSGGSQGKSNFHVPLVKWQLFTKWAKVVEAVLGDEAEIVAVPIGPSDSARAEKVGRYFTWRLFDYMKISNKLVHFFFNYLMFGRAHAYCPYRKDEFEIPGQPEPEVDYDGPDFNVISPDDLIVPAEEVQSIQDFTFVIRRCKETLQGLVEGEKAGRYVGIEENWAKLFPLAGKQRSSPSSNDNDQIKREQDLAEGVNYEWGGSSKESLEVWEWYGRWRPLKSDSEDAQLDAWDKREMGQIDLLVRVIPEANLVIGIQDLAAIYPKVRKRRPFVEISLIKDGSYWCPSFPELLEDMEDELTANFNNTTEAVERSVGPLIFYVPGGGFDPQSFKYEPNTAIAVENINNVKVVEMQVNSRGAIERDHTIISMAERTTGITDMNIGRASDRPNAPKTARQTLALMEEGNVRISLDTTVLRSDLKEVLSRIWSIDTMYSPDQVFFKVVEDQDEVGFDLQEGGAMITAAERMGQFDFHLKFADSVHSREAKKQEAMTMYQMDLGNPLIANDPHALWAISKKVHEAVFKDFNFADLVPEPPTQQEMMLAQMAGQVIGEDQAAEEIETNGPPPLPPEFIGSGTSEAGKAKPKTKSGELTKIAKKK